MAEEFIDEMLSTNDEIATTKETSAKNTKQIVDSLLDDLISDTDTYENTIIWKGDAKDVKVIGEFSNWVALTMSNQFEDTWTLTLKQKFGNYLLKFIVDGKYVLSEYLQKVIGPDQEMYNLLEFNSFAKHSDDELEISEYESDSDSITIRDDVKIIFNPFDDNFADDLQNTGYNAFVADINDELSIIYEEENSIKIENGEELNMKNVTETSGSINTNDTMKFVEEITNEQQIDNKLEDPIANHGMNDDSLTTYYKSSEEELSALVGNDGQDTTNNEEVYNILEVSSDVLNPLVNNQIEEIGVIEPSDTNIENDQKNSSTPLNDSFTDSLKDSGYEQSFEDLKQESSSDEEPKEAVEISGNILQNMIDTMTDSEVIENECEEPTDDYKTQENIIPILRETEQRNVFLGSSKQDINDEEQTTHNVEIIENKNQEANNEVVETSIQWEGYAKDVKVVGEFSNWEALTMSNEKEDIWNLTIKQKTGQFLLKFIVDEKYMISEYLQKVVGPDQEIYNVLEVIPNVRQPDDDLNVEKYDGDNIIIKDEETILNPFDDDFVVSEISEVTETMSDHEGRQIEKHSDQILIKEAVGISGSILKATETVFANRNMIDTVTDYKVEESKFEQTNGDDKINECIIPIIRDTEQLNVFLGCSKQIIEEIIEKVTENKEQIIENEEENIQETFEDNFHKTDSEVVETSIQWEGFAKDVKVIGEFSNWEALTLSNEKEDIWNLTIKQKSGQFLLKFIVDGKYTLSENLEKVIGSDQEVYNLLDVFPDEKTQMNKHAGENDAGNPIQETVNVVNDDLISDNLQLVDITEEEANIDQKMEMDAVETLEKTLGVTNYVIQSIKESSTSEPETKAHDNEEQSIPLIRQIIDDQLSVFLGNGEQNQVNDEGVFEREDIKMVNSNPYTADTGNENENKALKKLEKEKMIEEDIIEIIETNLFSEIAEKERNAEEEKIEMEKIEKLRRAEETEKIEKEIEKEKIEQERKAEEERIEQEKVEQSRRAEQERIEKENIEQARRDEEERLEKEKIEKERKAEEERIEQEKIEQAIRAEEERIKKEKIEKERKDEEKRIEQEKIEQERKAEEERIEQEKVEQARRAEEERIENEKMENERKAEEERIEQERIEQESKDEEERIQQEKIEKEIIEKDRKAEEERIEQERKAEQEKIEQEKIEQERRAEEKRIAKDKIEKEKIEQEKIEQERKAEQEKIKQEKIEQDRVAEVERIEKEKIELERNAEEERIYNDMASSKRRAEEERLTREAEERAIVEDIRIQMLIDKNNQLLLEEQEREEKERARLAREAEERAQVEEQVRKEEEKLEMLRIEKENEEQNRRKEQDTKRIQNFIKNNNQTILVDEKQMAVEKEVEYTETNDNPKQTDEKKGENNSAFVANDEINQQIEIDTSVNVPNGVNVANDGSVDNENATKVAIEQAKNAAEVTVANIEEVLMKKQETKEVSNGTFVALEVESEESSLDCRKKNTAMRKMLKLCQCNIL
eukprot:GFUD01024151.1.p1 GENE.GFUD01024151.1~~GFUD01024151.1.p1  ORF type:complete len:1611 (+),score=665.74 GFUD01024151.1:349-4833(+)